MTDISALKSGNRTIEILHPGDGTELGIRVTVMSIDDEALEKIKRNITDTRLKLEQRNKPISAELIDENRNNLLFSAIVKWEWYEQPEVREGDAKTGKVITPYREAPTFNGEKPDLNRRTAYAIFKALPWFIDQINEAVGETSAFFTPSKPN